MTSLHVELAKLDNDYPAFADNGVGWNRIEKFEALFSGRTTTSLTTEEIGTTPVIPPGSHVLSNGVEAPTNGKLKPERLAELLASTEVGKSVLASLPKG